MVVMSLKKKQTFIDSYIALSCHWQAATCPNAGINPSWQRDCTSRSSGDVQKMKERFVLNRCNRYGVATNNANVSFFCNLERKVSLGLFFVFEMLGKGVVFRD